MKTCVIDVGGGLKGIYTVGIYDYLMDKNISFDCGIGISAGSANLASYLANQKGRNFKFYTEYSFRKEYMGVGNLLHGHSFINLDYIYSTLSNSDGEYPFDYKKMVANPMLFYVIAANAETGEAKYFTKEDIKQDNYDIFKASCSIPVVCKPYVIEGIPYYDGAIADPVPVKKALEMKYDKIVLLLTRPCDKPREIGSDFKFADVIEKKYPNAAKNFRLRATRYNEGVELAKSLEKEGKALVVAPKDIFGITTLNKNREDLLKLYNEGYKDAVKIAEFLKM